MRSPGIRYLAGEPVALDKPLPDHLHMAGIERPAATVPMRVTRATDDAPQVARALIDRALGAGAARSGAVHRRARPELG